ncbi:MAG: hypothetical protein CMI60_22780 [Parvibaculum sp.]|nr:hypothetical protein [Parvibaculum sp.]|tara:strand:- start:672 stop:875 length:204 start_codon:yes stop_codon:yes gene_type:complete
MENTKIEIYYRTDKLKEMSIEEIQEIEDKLYAAYKQAETAKKYKKLFKEEPTNVDTLISIISTQNLE